VDQGYPIDVIYLDLQKAFDKVPHRRLMLKVKSFGIVGRMNGFKIGLRAGSKELFY